jgi:hypothetical protein
VSLMRQSLGRRSLGLDHPGLSPELLRAHVAEGEEKKQTGYLTSHMFIASIN